MTSTRTKLAVLTAIPAAAVISLAAPAFAGSPHFVGDPATTVSGGTLSVTQKEAGLGDEPQIHVALAGTAQCVNPGGNNPQAGNKVSFNQAADEPVQNGQSVYTISVTPVFQPPCSPPMTIAWTNVTLTDTTNHLTEPVTVSQIAALGGIKPLIYGD